MRSYSFILFFLSLLFNSCSSNFKQVEDYTKSKVVKQDLRLKHLKSFTIKTRSDSVTIANLLTKISVNSDGSRLAFKDLVYESILVVDNKGNILFTVGGSGKGPAEFVKILSWGFDENNNLIVVDEGQRLIKIFDSSGNLNKAVKIFRTENFGTVGRYLYAMNGLIYLPGTESEYIMNSWKSKLIAILNYRGETQKIIGKYDPYVEFGKIYLSDPIIDINFESGQIFSTHSNSYRIQVWDLKTFNRLAYFGRRSRNFEESDEKIESFLPQRKIFEMSINQSFTNGLFFTKKYLLFHFQNLTEEWFKERNTDDKIYFIAIYNRANHNFNAEIKLPYPL